MTSIYRYILKQAWTITWQYRWLWIFGLFAAVLGNGGVFNILINNITSIQNQGVLITDLNSVFTQGGSGALVASFIELFNNLNFVSILVLLLILALAIFILYLAITTQAGLVSGAFRLYKNQAVNLKESWQRGLKKFWPVLWLNVLGKASIYILLVALGLPFFFLYVSTQNLIWQWILLIISFMIFVPVAIIISFLIQYAVIFIVIKNSEFKMSLREAWELFKNNWIVSIEMAFILFIINILAGLGLLIGIFFVTLPFLIIGFISVSLAINGLFWLAIILGGIILILALFLFGAVLATFQTTVWVIFFTRLTEGIIIPKILRLAANWTVRKKA